MLLFKIYRFEEINDIEPIVGKHNLYLTSKTLAERFRGPIPLNEKRRWQFARKVLRFLSYCDWRMYENRTTELPISKKELVDHLGNDYLVYMNWLHEQQVLTPVMTNGKAYDMINGICKSWQFYKSYTGDNKSLCVFTDTRGKRELEYTSDDKYDPRFVETIRNIEIDLLSAIQAEREHCGLDTKRLHHRINLIFTLWDKRYIKKGNKVDRIYHSLTALSKVSRDYLHLSGSKFHNIDVVNCQPLILATLIKKNGLEVDEQYLNDCESGQFYERFITQDSSRDETKKLLYRNIFFGIKESSEVAKRFQELYPTTWTSLNTIREGLACQLQNLEAELFISVIPKKSKGWWPLHDAIYFTEEKDREQISRDLIHNFNKYGITPNIK